MTDFTSVHAYRLENGNPHPASSDGKVFRPYIYRDISELPEWLAERVAVAGLNEPMTWVDGALWYETDYGQRRYRIVLTPEDSVRWKKECDW